MRWNLLKSALVVAALAAPVAALASDPQARDQRNTRPDPRGEREARPELICRSIESAGSQASVALVCMTAADWRRETE
ncbi:MAG TPA: hypothetical protein VGB08_11390 [Allosphingosinicella sp.]